MSKQASKSEALTLTLRKFLASNKGINDITELLLVAAKNASRMNWEQIEEIVKEATAKRIKNMHWEAAERIEAMIHNALRKDVTHMRVDLSSVFSIEGMKLMGFTDLQHSAWDIGNHMDNSWHVVLEENGLVAYPDADDSEEESNNISLEG